MMLSKFDIVEYFRNTLANNDDLSTPVAAIYSMVEFVKYSTATTTFEFSNSLEAASKALKASTKNSVSLSAGCDLFVRYVYTTAAVYSDVAELKSDLIKRGQLLAQSSRNYREKTVKFGLPFIKDDAVILIHSYSKVVTLLLQRAAEAKRRFKVFVTESAPSYDGKKAATIISNMNIPVTVIVDTAVAYYMDKVDLVLVGAEGVVENGGLINHVGTYQIGIIAKAANKPVYAVAESFKFVRMFPLNQQDFEHSTDMMEYEVENGVIQPRREDGHEVCDPSVDYTPPEYITLLFTDQGVLTPSGVGDLLFSIWSDR